MGVSLRGGFNGSFGKSGDKPTRRRALRQAISCIPVQLWRPCSSLCGADAGRNEGVLVFRGGEHSHALGAKAHRNHDMSNSSTLSTFSASHWWQMAIGGSSPRTDARCSSHQAFHRSCRHAGSHAWRASHWAWLYCIACCADACHQRFPDRWARRWMNRCLGNPASFVNLPL